MDRYTKTVLTIIAAALSIIAFQEITKPATAQMIGCGAGRNPCYIAFPPGRELCSVGAPCYVQVIR